MNDAIPVFAFVLILLVFQIAYVESYSLKCPSQANWNIRAKLKCNSTLKYFCLYNNIEEKYVEGCEGPDWDRKGSKRIFSVYFTRGECIPKRYQPFKFKTNESMSDCIFAKSLCSEEGHIVYEDGSTKDDTTCRCDYTRNYSFIKTPRHFCFCIPTEEDCSCYIQSCPVNLTLTTDYDCSSNSYKEKPKCMEITRYSKTKDEKTQVNMEKDDLWLNNMSAEPRRNATPTVLILIFLCIIYIFVAGEFILNHTGFTIASKWLKEKLQPLKRYFGRGQKDADHTGVRTKESVRAVDKVECGSCEEDNDSFKSSKELLDVEIHQPPKLAKETTDEVNFLRLIHLLFRVACPVIRMTFNHEIQPKQLRKSLDKHKILLEKKHRKKENLINDYQWDLLYSHAKDKTVTSDDFDIRLMIYLLRTLANIEVGDLYPVQSDRRISAMLSRIKYIRNEAMQIFEGKLSEDLFNKYWDDIGQAILKLVSSYGMMDNKEKTQLISRLFQMNPIDLDNDKLCIYIFMSEIYPAKILQQIISEYCTLKQVTIGDVLRQIKHELYHKRIKTELCCKCTDTNFSTYIKVITEKQWGALYEINDDNNTHSCPSELKECSEHFVPKKVDTCDLSVALPLVLYIPDILTHIINRLYMNKLDTFLMNNKHALYHSMEKERCCNCNSVPTEKTILSRKEWSKLFQKIENSTRHSCTKDCCCQFAAINGIKSSDMDETLLSKIVHVAGPISVLNKIGQAAFLYFLNWTVDAQPLRGAITELLNVIEDETVRHEMLQRISSCSLSQLAENTVKLDAPRWVFKQLQNQKATLETPFEIHLFDKDSLKVKSVNIPKDASLPNKTRYFKDLTDEEINFLLVVYGITKIVYPAITHELNTKCPDDELDKIRMEIYEQQQRQDRNDSRSDENKRQKKKIYLTQKQQGQLFSPKMEESRNLDLKLMIYILRKKIEEEGNQDYVHQLDVIDTIRKEIFQSSSGVLDDIKFKAIMELIRKAVVHFGEEMYEEKIVSLQRIRNCLE